MVKVSAKGLGEEEVTALFETMMPRAKSGREHMLDAEPVDVQDPDPVEHGEFKIFRGESMATFTFTNPLRWWHSRLGRPSWTSWRTRSRRSLRRIELRSKRMRC